MLKSDPIRSSPSIDRSSVFFNTINNEREFPILFLLKQLMLLLTLMCIFSLVCFGCCLYCRQHCEWTDCFRRKIAPSCNSNLKSNVEYRTPNIEQRIFNVRIEFTVEKPDQNRIRKWGKWFFSSILKLETKGEKQLRHCQCFTQTHIKLASKQTNKQTNNRKTHEVEGWINGRAGTQMAQTGAR